MRLEILKQSLLKAVSIASRFTSSKTNLPILANLLLSAKSSKFVVSATNLEVSIQIGLGAKILHPGEITISARTVQDYLASLSEGKIELSLEGQQMKVVAENSEASLVTIGAGDFPKFPTLKEETLLTLGREALKTLIDKTIFAAATDQARPVLTGVLIRLAQNEVVFVSTDGFRLSESRLPLEKGVGFSGDLIVPAASLQELLRLLSEEEVEEVDVLGSVDRNQIGFSAGNYTMITRLLESDYPDYQRIIPTEKKLEVLVDQDKLLQAVKSASIFAGTDSQTIRLEFEVSEKQILVTGQSASLGESKTKVPATLKGQDQVLAFNARFLKEGIGSVSGPELMIRVKEATSPAIFSTPGENNYQHIVMPIRLEQKSA